MDKLLWMALGAVAAYFYIQRNPAVLSQFGTPTPTPTGTTVNLPGGFTVGVPSGIVAPGTMPGAVPNTPAYQSWQCQQTGTCIPGVPIVN